MTRCNCKHWSPRTDGVAGGYCALGHLGPTVSFRTCERACEKYDGPEPRVVGLPQLPPQAFAPPRPQAAAAAKTSTATQSTPRKGCGCSRAERSKTKK